MAPLAQSPVTSKQANGRWITYVYGNYKKSKPKFRAEGTALPIHSIAQTPLRIGGKIKTTKRRGQIHRQGLSSPQSRSLGNPSVSVSLNIFQQFSAKIVHSVVLCFYSPVAYFFTICILLYSRRGEEESHCFGGNNSPTSPALLCNWCQSYSQLRQSVITEDSTV